MPRPRLVSDAQILDATARVVAREGPLRFTLQDVAAEVGVTPAALLRRFATKRGILLALVEREAGLVAPRFALARAKHDSPTHALLAALTEGVASWTTRAHVAHSLAFLQLDFTDAEFHQHAQAYFAALQEEIAACLDGAADAGEIKRVDTRALAHMVEVVYDGALISWAVRGDGSAADAARRDVLALLEPHQRKRGAGLRVTLGLEE